MVGRLFMARAPRDCARTAPLARARRVALVPANALLVQQGNGTRPVQLSAFPVQPGVGVGKAQLSAVFVKLADGVLEILAVARLVQQGSGAQTWVRVIALPV